MVEDQSGFVQTTLKSFLSGLSDESKEVLKLEFEALAQSVGERSAVSLKTALEGITLDETETYWALRDFAAPAELAAITAVVDHVFIGGPVDRWDSIDEGAIPSCLNLRAKESRERAGELRERAARWFGARVGTAARKNEHFLWPSWFRDDSDHSLLMFDWPMRLPCPCCGSNRDGVFTGLQPIWQFDEAHPRFARIPACQKCGHVDSIGCACSVCDTEWARVFRVFSEHLYGLKSHLRALVAIAGGTDNP